MFAILAAALYAINVPLSKILLQKAGAAMMAAFLYLGAGIGLMIYSFMSRALGKKPISEPLTPKELGAAKTSTLLMIRDTMENKYGENVKNGE